jgi:hypothetical protein
MDFTMKHGYHETFIVKDITMNIGIMFQWISNLPSCLPKFFLIGKLVNMNTRITILNTRGGLPRGNIQSVSWESHTFS